MSHATAIDLLDAGDKRKKPIVFPLFRNPPPHVNLTQALKDGTVGMGILPKSSAAQSILDEEDERILKVLDDA